MPYNIEAFEIEGMRQAKEYLESSRQLFIKSGNLLEGTQSMFIRHFDNMRDHYAEHIELNRPFGFEYISNEYIEGLLTNSTRFMEEFIKRMSRSLIQKIFFAIQRNELQKRYDREVDVTWHYYGNQGVETLYTISFVDQNLRFKILDGYMNDGHTQKKLMGHFDSTMIYPT